MTYEIYTSDVYPLSAPNDSKILICGHDNGILVIWRGGRPFGPPKSQTEPSKNQEIIIIDSDDGDEKIPPVEFADQEEDIDPSAPYSPIIQKLDLPLGTAILHIAFPRLPQLSRPQAHPLAPAFLQDKMVIALACADNSIRVLTLPLRPPSTALLSSKMLRNDVTLAFAGNRTWGEELVTLPNAHQSLPKGVSIVFAPAAMFQDNMAKTEGRNEGFVVLLASHSADLSGMLHIHQIRLNKKGQGLDTVPGRARLWRSIPISAPAASIDMFVSTNSLQSPRVLVAELTGAVRIFECLTGQVPDMGRWSLSLFCPPVDHILNHSQTVISARWVLGGQAIAVLNVEGEWGIWDVSSISGGRTVSGNMPTPFTISGRVGNAITTTSAQKSSNSKPEARSSLAPMTPSTRKARQDVLFSGKSESSSIRGGISLKISAGSITASDGDESILFWHGERVVVIPSLLMHWRNKFRGPGSIFTSSANGHIREIAPVALPGELRTAVTAFPMEESSSVSNMRQLDILIAGERSFTILAAPLIPKESTDLALVHERDRDDDQTLLGRGQLSVDGLDRMLDTMASGGGASFGPSAPRSNGKIQFR